MQREENARGYEVNQLGALVTLLVMSAWSLTVVGTYLITPKSLDKIETVFLGTITLMFLVLVPLYWKRIRWSYLAGIIIIFCVFLGAGKAVLDRSLNFSVSAYNLSVIAAYLIAAANLYFSYRSYKILGQSSRKTSILGLSGVITLAAIIAITLWINAGDLEYHRARFVLNNIDRELEGIDTMDGKIQFLMSKGNIPSLAAGIVINDSLIWHGGYGTYSPDTMYNIASITKPFTATAIMQLYEQELLDLDADINKYLPFKIRHPDYAEKPISLRMLLSHRSGLASGTARFRDYVLGKEMLDWLSGNRGWDITNYDSAIPPGDFLGGYLVTGGPYYSTNVWLSIEPGTEYNYSNAGYLLLAYIVDRVTGQTITDYLQENILTPLNMNDTVFGVAGFNGKHAVPYDHSYSVLSQTNIELPQYEKRVGAGGIRSSVSDLGQFLIMHMNQGKVKGVQLLESETVSLMHEEVVSVPPGSGDTGQTGYGLGFIHLSSEHVKLWGNDYYLYGAIGHGGSDWGYNSSMWFVEGVQGGYGIVLLTNVKPMLDWDDLWYCGTYYKIQEILMETAHYRFGQITRNSEKPSYSPGMDK